jgi:hypothetical protein
MDVRLSLRILVVAAAVVVPGGARGQYTDLNWNNWNNPTSAMLGDWIVIKMQEDAMRRAFGGRSPEAKAAASKPARKAPTTTFKPAPRRLAIAKAAEAQRRNMEKLLGVCDKVFAQSLARFEVAGGTNDLALSLAFAISMDHYVHWMGKPGAPRVADKRHFARLRESMRSHLVGRDKFGKLDDARKQEVHDHLVLMGCTPMMQYQAGRKAGDEAAMRQAQESAAKHLKTLGLAPDSIAFQPDGTLTFSRKMTSAQP